MNSVIIFTSNIFHLLSHALNGHRALQAPIHTPSSKRMIHTPSEEAPTRERERSRTQKTQDRRTTSESHQWVAPPHEPEIVAPRTHEPRVTLRQSHQRVALQTHELWVAPRRSHQRVAPWTHEPVTDLVLILVWNFCNKICLWFWFFCCCCVVWVVVFWWFSCCVVVENSIFRILPNTWKYFLEKFS